MCITFYFSHGILVKEYRRALKSMTDCPKSTSTSYFSLFHLTRILTIQLKNAKPIIITINFKLILYLNIYQIGLKFGE